MMKFADIVDKNSTEIAEWESKSMGQPMIMAKGLASLVSSVFRYVILDSQYISLRGHS